MLGIILLFHINTRKKEEAQHKIREYFEKTHVTKLTHDVFIKEIGDRQKMIVRGSNDIYLFGGEI